MTLPFPEFVTHPDCENPPKAPSRPIVFQFPTVGMEHAEKVLALTLSAVFCLTGAGFKISAPFADDNLRYERLSGEGDSFIQLGLSLGFGTGVVGAASNLVKKYGEHDDEL